MALTRSSGEAIRERRRCSLASGRPLWPNLEPMSEISAWVALDDIDEHNGCMSMVLGSHLWDSNLEFLFKLPSFSELPAMFYDHKIEAQTCPVRKGEIHYHHALTWHGSPWKWPADDHVVRLRSSICPA